MIQIKKRKVVIVKMYLFFTLEQIQHFEIFSRFNFSLFSDFQLLAILIAVNAFYLMFLSFVFTIIYKTFNRLINIFF